MINDIYKSFKVTTGIFIAVAGSTFVFSNSVLLPLNTLGRLGTSMAIRNVEKQFTDYLHRSK